MESELVALSGQLLKKAGVGQVTVTGTWCLLSVVRKVNLTVFKSQTDTSENLFLHQLQHLSWHSLSSHMLQSLAVSPQKDLSSVLGLQWAQACHHTNTAVTLNGRWKWSFFILSASWPNSTTSFLLLDLWFSNLLHFRIIEGGVECKNLVY